MCVYIYVHAYVNIYIYIHTNINFIKKWESVLIKPYYATTFPIIRERSEKKKHFQIKSLTRGNIYIFFFFFDLYRRFMQHIGAIEEK